MVGQSLSKTAHISSFLVFTHLTVYLIMGAPMHPPPPLISAGHWNLAFDAGNDVAPAPGFSVVQTAEHTLAPVWRQNVVPVAYTSHWSCEYEPVTWITNHIVPNVPNPQQAPVHGAAPTGLRPNAVPFQSGYSDGRTRESPMVTCEEKNSKGFGGGPYQPRANTQANSDGVFNASLGRPQVATVPSPLARTAKSAINPSKVTENAEKRNELIFGSIDARPKILDQSGSEVKGKARPNFLKNDMTTQVYRVVNRAGHTSEEARDPTQNKETRVSRVASRAANTSGQPQSKHTSDLALSGGRVNTVIKERNSSEGTTDLLQKSNSDGLSSACHKGITDAVSGNIHMGDTQNTAQIFAATKLASIKENPVVNEKGDDFPLTNRNVEGDGSSQKRTSEYSDDPEAIIKNVSPDTAPNSKQTGNNSLPQEGNITLMKTPIKSTQPDGKDLVTDKIGTSSRSARNQFTHERAPMANLPEAPQNSIGSTENGIPLIRPAESEITEPAMNKNDQSNKAEVLVFSDTALNGNQNHKSHLSKDDNLLMKESPTTSIRKGREDSLQVKIRASLPILADKNQPTSGKNVGTPKHVPGEVLKSSPSLSENGMGLETAVHSYKNALLKKPATLNTVKNNEGGIKKIEATAPILPAHTVNTQDTDSSKQSLFDSSGFEYTNSELTSPFLGKRLANSEPKITPVVDDISPKATIVKFDTDTNGIMLRNKVDEIAKKDINTKNEPKHGPRKVQVQDLNSDKNPQIGSTFTNQEIPAKEISVPKNQESSSEIVEGGILTLKEE
ncbi:hypothetical protein PtA15_10A573 [Puccinia triticina]|uniref:Uncharacterized protein n=1 Tax=Puccinia triticina TaxID=208348 RepID=A0ABY7CV43_9BASI|nr:uncharacterized protein PtA15_10A573 [Puccinia triticina]WAQ89149.1 hypothetical protein PtA15_10A573 [Puccinia triticina]